MDKSVKATEEKEAGEESQNFKSIGDVWMERRYEGTPRGLLKYFHHRRRTDPPRLYQNDGGNWYITKRA